MHYDRSCSCLDGRQVFHPDVYSEKHYRWAHAILDSRAIWWNGERHLVPLLDLVNCKEGPSPDKIHSTNLDETVRRTHSPLGGGLARLMVVETNDSVGILCVQCRELRR